MTLWVQVSVAVPNTGRRGDERFGGQGRSALRTWSWFHDDTSRELRWLRREINGMGKQPVEAPVLTCDEGRHYVEEEEDLPSRAIQNDEPN
jgi:hypothetical protein